MPHGVSSNQLIRSHSRYRLYGFAYTDVTEITLCIYVHNDGNYGSIVVNALEERLLFL